MSRRARRVLRMLALRLLVIVPLAIALTLCTSAAIALWRPINLQGWTGASAFLSSDRTRAWCVWKHASIFGHSALESQPLSVPVLVSDDGRTVEVQEQIDCDPVLHRMTYSLIDAPPGDWDLPTRKTDMPRIEHQFGWPFRAMRARFESGFYSTDVYPLSARHRQWMRDASVSPTVVVFSPFRAGETPLLPLAILWRGLLANVVAWSCVMLGVCTSFTFLRDVLRSRRGVCTQCGYSLVGLDAKTCPECGSPRNP